MAPQVVPPLDNRICEILNLIASELHNPLSIAKLARRAGLSASQLQRLFRRHLGMPPATYLIRIRMDRARALLLSTRLAVKEVSVEAGYHDVSHFAKAFKRQYGQTPTHYRKIAWALGSSRAFEVSALNEGELVQKDDAAFGPEND